MPDKFDEWCIYERNHSYITLFIFKFQQIIIEEAHSDIVVLFEEGPVVWLEHKDIRRDISLSSSLI